MLFTSVAIGQSNYFGFGFTITNSQYDQLPVGLIAQLVELAEVMGSNPVQA